MHYVFLVRAALHASDYEQLFSCRLVKNVELLYAFLLSFIAIFTMAAPGFVDEFDLQNTLMPFSPFASVAMAVQFGDRV